MQEKQNDTPNIYLVGMMGAGKSTIGKILAKELHRRFVDIDLLIEERCGVTIPVIFEHEGESGFRKRETEVLVEVMGYRDCVVATGGGIVTLERNRQLLYPEDWVIYLKAQVDDIYQRTRYDKNRPLLQTSNPIERITLLLEERDPWYTEVSKVVIPTEKQSASKVIAHILEILGQS